MAGENYRKQLPALGGLFLLLIQGCSSGHDIAPVGYVGSPTNLGAGGSKGDDIKTLALGGQGGEAPTSSGGRTNFGPPVTGPKSPDLGAPLCLPGASWSEAQALLELNTEAEESLLALSPDETAVVFLRETVAFLGEREAPSAAFQVEQLAWPSGYDPELGVAISPDALTLVLVANESSGFALLTRKTRDEDFGQDVEIDRLSVLNSLPGTAGIGLSHPLLVRGGAELWWVESRSETSVWMASFGAEFVPRGVQVGCGELGCDLMLEGLGGQGKFPSSLSEDGRSLFLLDEYSGSELRHREQSEVDSGFFEAETMGAREDVHANAACSRLYFSRAGELFFEERLD